MSLENHRRPVHKYVRVREYVDWLIQKGVVLGRKRDRANAIQAILVAIKRNRIAGAKVGESAYPESKGKREAPPPWLIPVDKDGWITGYTFSLKSGFRPYWTRPLDPEEIDAMLDNDFDIETLAL